MSDNIIRKDDLVRVVRHPCCGASLEHYGTVERFTTVRTEGRDFFTCGYCFTRGIAPSDEPLAVTEDFIMPVAWLRKVPPLSELESIDDQEEIHA